MVRFADGKADKKSYRRFKIKSFVGNDDFRSMEEVVGRRYGRLLKAGQTFPDLVVIDGGAGQVSSALKCIQGFKYPSTSFGWARKERRINCFSRRKG